MVFFITISIFDFTVNPLPPFLFSVHLFHLSFSIIFGFCAFCIPLLHPAVYAYALLPLNSTRCVNWMKTTPNESQANTQESCLV